MLDKKVVELLNQQVNKEFYSAYLYLDFPIIIMIMDWTGSATGTGSRRRKKGTTRCFSSSICRTTEKK